MAKPAKASGHPLLLLRVRADVEEAFRRLCAMENRPQGQQFELVYEGWRRLKRPVGWDAESGATAPEVRRLAFRVRADVQTDFRKTAEKERRPLGRQFEVIFKEWEASHRAA